jgi:amino-acid N-acetyltransferase
MKFDDIRGILRYVPQFRGQTFVVLVEGEVIDSENFANVLMDLAVLHSLSIRVVLVYGARHQIREQAQRLGVNLSSHDGIGATDQPTLEVALDAISRLGTHLMQQLTTVNLQAAMTNAVVAHPAGVIKGKDLGHTGTIDRVDEHMLQALIDKDMIPIVAPLGYDRIGRTLRLNSAAVACQIAVELKAAKLLFVVPDAFIQGDGKRMRQLSVEEAKVFAEQLNHQPEPSRAHQLRTAARACESGVPRAHFVDGRLDEALLGELFSNEGVGTMVYADAYQQIRPARRSDIPAILSMIQQAVNDQELVARNRQEIRERLHDYFVLEVDGNLLGLVAVHAWPEHKLAEVGCLYIRKSHEGQGYGTRLVSYAEKRARDLKAERIFALSTQAYHYFESKLGYSMWTADELPETRRVKLAKSGRNSKVLVKPLV